MSIEIILLPMLLAAIGYILYTVRDFLYCTILVQVTIEELDEFMEAAMEVLKKHVINRNWTIGRYSMLKKNADFKILRDPTESLGLDSGMYIGRYRGKMLLATIDDWVNSSFGDWTPRHPKIRLITWRWNEKHLLELMEEISINEKPIDFFTTGQQCESVRGRIRSGFEGLFLPQNLQEELEQLVKWFVSPAGETWYRKMQQPYKLVLLLYGQPGTGKTAVAKAIADITKRSLVHTRLVCTRENVDISHETVSSVVQFRDDVILFDEIDKLFIEETKGSKMDPATLLAILNGDMLHGQIIVLTANDLECIPASFRDSLLRSRRVDKQYQFKNATDEQKLSACKHFGVQPTADLLAKVSMADVIDCIMSRFQTNGHEVLASPQESDVQELRNRRHNEGKWQFGRHRTRT